MFVGGYISAAGLGLTCPEWPLCPNGIMPDDEYFIEWVHRTVAATTGVLFWLPQLALGLTRMQEEKLNLLVHLQVHLWLLKLHLVQ